MELKDIYSNYTLDVENEKENLTWKRK